MLQTEEKQSNQAPFPKLMITMLDRIQQNNSETTKGTHVLKGPRQAATMTHKEQLGPDHYNAMVLAKTIAL